MEEGKLHAARVATLFVIARPVYAGSLVLGAMLVVLLWGVYPLQSLLTWLGALAVVMVARMAVHWAYIHDDRKAERPAQWENRFAAGALASGTVWACVPLLFLPHDRPLLEAGLVILGGGVIISAIGLTAASVRAMLAFAALPLASMTIELARQADATHRLIAIALLLFGFVMARMAREMNASLAGALREKLENQRLRERAEGSETRLRDAIESFPEGIAVWDADDRLVVCNETYARLYGGGRASAELVGTPFEHVAANAWVTEHPAGRADDSARAEWIAGRIAHHREGSGAAQEYQGRDARWRQVKTVRMRAGGWVGVVTDVNELKSAQERFLKVLQEEDLVLDTLPVGIAFIENQVVVRCNRRLEQILGYGPGEIEGRSTRLWFTSDERWNEAREESYRRMADGGIMEGDARLVRKDGTRTWCRVIGRPIDVHGAQKSSILTFADIDERLAAETALRESEEKLRLAVDAADLTYWEWDRERGLLGWGEGRARPWQEYRDHVHPDDREHYLAAVEAAWEGGDPYWCEYRVVRGDGTVRWISARGKTMTNGGPAKRMIGVAQDVTERKMQEEAVRFLADHDSLTGLPNRRLLDDRLRRAVVTAERRGTRAAAMLIDLDDFKRVNDSAGHRAGDGVLREAAQRLSACVRKADTLARHGGDEFVVVLADVQSDADARTVADKILRALELPFAVDGAQFRLGASIGISMFPRDAADAEALLRNADAAMYRAKQLGRNRYRLHGE